MAANTHKLVTNNFKNYSVNQFIESLTEPANTIFYAFAGKHTEYTGGDSNVAYPNNSTQSLSIDAYRQMVFGKQITGNDVKVMIPRYDWTAGTVYTQYSDRDGELFGKMFYTISRAGSNYYVFKCLFNNNGAPSTIKPDYNETAADDIIYETSDGYQWKYLFTITKDVFDKFATTSYIPVIEDTNVTANAIFGAIDVITVSSNGAGYNNFYSGQFKTEDVAVNGNTLVYNIGSDASPANNQYYSCIIKITEGKGKGGYRKVNGYRVSGNTKQIIVNSAFTTAPDATSTYEISPLVLITGDGKQTAEAEARALVNTAASNSIYKIEILNRGAGYCFAFANAQVSNVISISNSANLAVVIPPRGGHGANVQAELGGSRAGISVSFANGESNTILTENDYRVIGIIKDPAFSNVGLTVGNISGTFAANEKLYQVRPIKIDGMVTINTTSNSITSNSVNLQDTFKVNDYVYIADLKGSEVTNILVSQGGSGYVTGDSLTFTGGGGSGAVAYAVTVNGAITEVRFNSITNLTFSSGGSGFRNNQSLGITGQTSGNSSATGFATTNATGGLTSITLTSGGKGYTNNETVTVQGQASYVNGTVLFSNTTAQTFFGNTDSVLIGNATVNGFIGLGTNRTRFVNNDIVTYIANSGNTVLGGLTNNTSYFVITTNATHIQLTATNSGAAINLTSVPTSIQTHSLTPLSASLTNAVYTATVPNGGAGFTNNQTVNIKGVNSVVNVATGLATTNVTGGLTSVSIVENGFSYVENESVQISSSTSSSNASGTVDTANGVIRSAILSSSGYDYSSAPSVGVTTTGGSGANLSAVVNTTPISSRRMLAKIGSIANATTMSLMSNGLFTDSTATIFLANVGASGTIDTFDVDLIQVQNSVGFFTVNSFVIGNTSLATANIDSIQISGATKPYTTFLQAIRYEGSIAISGTYVEDEKVIQDTAGAFLANAYLHTANTLNNTIYVTEEQGNFLIANTITGANSGATLTINNIYKGDLVPWSGDVVYIQNMDPIARSAEQTETIKIILEL